MKKTILRTIHGLTICLIAAFLTSCATLPSNINKQAQKKERMMFSEKKPGNTTWETPQLRLNYSATVEAGQYMLHGSAMVKESVTNSYPGMEFLNIYIYFLDAEGNYISEKAFRPAYIFHSPVPEEMSLKTSFPLPEGAKGIAFGYWGKLISLSASGENLGYWEIYHNPFSKKKYM